MLAQLAKLGNHVLDFFLPQSCLGCGREGELICPVCSRLLPPLTPPLCRRCGLPQAPDQACPDCSRHELSIDGIRSAFRFEGLVRHAIHQFKYQNLRSLARPLARFLAEHLTQNPLGADALVPVPLHPQRLRQRGYNQSALLARELGSLTGLRVVSGSLRRRLNTPPQARTASAEERLKNMAGAFVCSRDGLLGQRVLLIDDVATSGATLDGCARTLKQAGAASVWGLTFAREV